MLTLPIQIGKKYVRRDGVVVVAKAPSHDSDKERYALVTIGDEPACSDAHVILETGRSCYECKTAATRQTPYDLIADAEQKPAGHPHAALMALYAQDAAETETPAMRWQYRYKNASIWCNFAHSSLSPTWDINYQYRRKPRTIKIGDCEIQAPERVAPAVGSPYWIPVITGELAWQNTHTAMMLLMLDLLSAALYTLPTKQPEPTQEPSSP